MKRKKMSELTPRQKELRREKTLMNKLQKDADKLWHKVVIKKYGATCFFHDHQMSAKNHARVAVNCHHFKPKGMYPELRYDIENGIPMCWPCHFKLEQSDPSMREEIMLKRGNEWYLSLMKRSGIKKSFKNIEYYNKTIKILEEKLNQ